MTPDPMPHPPEEFPTEQLPALAPSPPPRRTSWFRRVISVLLIVLCLELGLFLLIYPWTDSWSANYFSWIGPPRLEPVWHAFWNNTYLRGAISGVGLLNIWVAVADALRMYIGGSDQPE